MAWVFFLLAVALTVPILGLAILSAQWEAYLVAALFLAPFWFLWWKVVQLTRPRAQLRQFDLDELVQRDAGLRQFDLDELLQRDAALLEPDEESSLIDYAKEIEKERKRKTDLAWARRVIEDEASVERSSPGRKGIPRAVRHAVWSRDGGRCVECGSSEKLEFDHIIPLSRGGSNTERNIQLLCESCNRRKGATLG